MRIRGGRILRKLQGVVRAIFLYRYFSGSTCIKRATVSPILGEGLSSICAMRASPTDFREPLDPGVAIPALAWRPFLLPQPHL